MLPIFFLISQQRDLRHFNPERLQVIVRIRRYLCRRGINAKMSKQTH